MKLFLFSCWHCVGGSQRFQRSGKLSIYLLFSASCCQSKQVCERDPPELVRGGGVGSSHLQAQSSVQWAPIAAWVLLGSVKEEPSYNKMRYKWRAAVSAGPQPAQRASQGGGRRKGFRPPDH